MALTDFLFATPLLLLSLLVIASASDYGNGPKPDSYKSMLEEHVKSYQEKSSENGYGPKLDFYKPKSGEKVKPNIGKSSENGYGPKQGLDKSKSGEKEKPLPIGIEGLILCKSGPKYVPIQGAVARITCLAVDEHGYETAPFSILSGETDAKGYFFATLCPSQLKDKLKLKECKAFLEKSPLETCKVPTDVNKGITGALLSSYHILNDKKMKLYSVGPFFYTSQANSVPNGY